MSNEKKQMKLKIITVCLLIVFFWIMLPVANVQAASKAALNKTSLTMYVGETYHLKVNNTSKKVTWTSESKKVATVSPKGLVKARRQGSVKIKASVGKKHFFCRVTVKKLAVKKQKALNAYKKALNKSNINVAGDIYNASNVQFAIIDVNHDSVPELIIANYDQHIYGYENGSIKKIEWFPASYMLQYFEKGNILRGARMSYGVLYEGIYRISNGKLKIVARAEYPDLEDPTYMIGNKKITKKKYDAYVKKISKNSKYHDVEYHEVTPENIKKYLK